MTRYLVQSRDRIFVKGYGFLSSAKNMDKNISKSLTGKYILVMLAALQKPFDHAGKTATDTFKASSERVIQEEKEATGYVIGNKSANKVTKLSKNSQ